MGRRGPWSGVRVGEGQRDQEQLKRAMEGWRESERIGEDQGELKRAMVYRKGLEGFERTRNGWRRPGWGGESPGWE